MSEWNVVYSVSFKVEAEDAQEAEDLGYDEFHRFFSSYYLDELMDQFGCLVEEEQ